MTLINKTKFLSDANFHIRMIYRLNTPINSIPKAYKLYHCAIALLDVGFGMFVSCLMYGCVCQPVLFHGRTRSPYLYRCV